MVRPLTKCSKEGVRYVRPQAVETAIEVALQEDPATLRKRLLVTDKALPDYLSSECLVHLIRDGLRRKDDERMDRALQVLLGRCELNLRTKIVNSLPNADHLREEVLSEFSELLASDGTGERPDDLDFYECKFNAAFQAFRIDAVNRELKRLHSIAEPPSPEDEREPSAYEEAALAPLSSALQTPAQHRSLFRKEVIEAIKALPLDERKALVLCHVYGYKVESTDQDDVTVATLCKCSGRTIRNRLSRAAARLSQFKEDIWTLS